MAHDVFVSYSSSDKTTADAVCARLEGRGIRCWIAPRDVLPGADWGAAIIDAINESRVMVLVYSARANDSAQIKREIERAVNKGIPIIPLRLENVPMSKTLEYFISTPHWLDAMTGPLDQHLDYLGQSISALLQQGPGASAPAATTAPAASPSATTASSAAPAEPLLDLRSTIGSFIDPSKLPRRQTLAEALLPASGTAATVGLVAAGVVLLTLGALLRVPFWSTSVLHVFTVLVVGAALGSRLGGLAASIYVLAGILLPIYPGGRNAFTLHANEPFAQSALGYLIGIVVSAFLMGWLAERHSWDRTYVKAALMSAIGSLIIYGLAQAWLSADLFLTRSSVPMRSFDFVPAILALVGSVVVFTYALPTAWKWVETQRSKRLAPAVEAAS